MKFRKILAALIAAVALSGCADLRGQLIDEIKESNSEENSESLQSSDSSASADDFEYREENGGIVIEKYLGKSEEVAVPQKIDGKTVVEIGCKAFRESENIRQVEIPETVVKIGKNDSLKFYEGEEQNAEKLVVTGLNLKSAIAAYDSIYRESIIAIELDEEGAEKFAEATERLAETAGIISIWLDGEKLFAPRVHEKISNGKMNISGGLTVDSAMDLAQKMSGNPFAGCKNIEVKYKGKTYGYDNLNELLLAVEKQ